MKFYLGDRVFLTEPGAASKRGMVTALKKGDPLLGVLWDGARNHEGILKEDVSLLVNERLQQAADLIAGFADRCLGADPQLGDAIGWLAESGIEPRQPGEAFQNNVTSSVIEL